MNNQSYSSKIRESELNFTRAWAEAMTGQSSLDDLTARIGPVLPFSFVLGDRFSRQIQVQWNVRSGDWDQTKRLHKLSCTDQISGVELTVELTEYSDYPALEWILHFTNTSSQASPQLSQVKAIDLNWQAAGTTPVLHRSRGSDERPDDFQYISEELVQLRTNQRSVNMTSGAGSATGQALDGRSSVDWLPFFNLQTADKGLIVAVGWTGQWFADFVHDGEGNVHVQAGMQFTDLSLQLGESIRSPKILVMYYEDNPVHAQNMLRQFILKYHTPQVQGAPAIAPFSHGSWGGAPTHEHMELIGKIKERKLPYDYYWIDAGWYGTGTEPCPDVFHGDWGRTGDWQVNPHRHPNGLRPIRDAARAAGMKFLLWIEPIRACYTTPVTLQHPEWFLSLTGKPAEPNESLLLNLGNAEACNWAIETVSGLIEEIGIDCYREDFNFFGSLQCFLRTDPPGRQGITEIRFIEGLYRFWDTLLERFPDLLIDNCASGGRRIDLETISRSIALWRTDYDCFKINNDALQVHSAGLANWVPLSGTSPVAEPLDTYAFRSGLCAAYAFGIDEFGLAKKDNSDAAAWDWHRRMMEEFLMVRPYWYGDYYPLMSCSLEPDTWMAYQLHREDWNKGVLLAYRRPQSPLVQAEFVLRGLLPGTQYYFNNLDTGVSGPLTASDTGLLTLNVTIPEPRTAYIIHYYSE